MDIQYETIGICGLGCQLCPSHNRDTESRCEGCKSKGRMAVGCPFITCAVKKREIEFCWQCDQKKACECWKKHRTSGMTHDSFKCYQTLETDIAFIEQYGVEEFDKVQKVREGMLREMLTEFNEGRSKSYYCIAATVMELDELRDALDKARQISNTLDIKEKSATLHSLLDEIAQRKGYLLRLRRQK